MFFLGLCYIYFTYVKNKDEELTRAGFGHNVSGMLLYARTDELVLPNNEYRMSGNRISVKTLDLDQEFSVIAEQLDQIAENYFQT